MSKNCRFAFAVHVAAVLALTPDQPCTSDWLAGSVNTNPVVIRRILSALAKAGLVRSVRGSQGGTMLSRPPEAITLLELSRAVDDDVDQGHKTSEFLRQVREHPGGTERQGHHRQHGQDERDRGQGTALSCSIGAARPVGAAPPLRRRSASRPPGRRASRLRSS